MSHEFKPVWICATDRSDKILSQRQWFHMSHEAICCSNLSRRCVAAICRIVSLGLKSYHCLCITQSPTSGQTLKAEAHDATNRCDTSPRQVAATNRLVWHVKIIVAATDFVATICPTNSNWFEFVRHIVATKQVQATCRSNSADKATYRSYVSLRFVASCVSVFSTKTIYIVLQTSAWLF